MEIVRCVSLWSKHKLLVSRKLDSCETMCILYKNGKHSFEKITEEELLTCVGSGSVWPCMCGSIDHTYMH